MGILNKITLSSAFTIHFYLKLIRNGTIWLPYVVVYFWEPSRLTLRKRSEEVGVEARRGSGSGLHSE